MGVSRPTLPSATNWSTTVATKVFVLLPARTRPSRGTGTWLPSREEPATRDVVRPPVVTEASAAGNFSWLTSASRLFRSAGTGGAPAADAVVSAAPSSPAVVRATTPLRIVEVALLCIGFSFSGADRHPKEWPDPPRRSVALPTEPG
jgi:hypothetical protein